VVQGNEGVWVYNNEEMVSSAFVAAIGGKAIKGNFLLVVLLGV
jgi:hypothetical protein